VSHQRRPLTRSRRIGIAMASLVALLLTVAVAKVPLPAAGAQVAPTTAPTTTAAPTTTTPPIMSRYVALGDSFSAGEGVSPFDPGTDIRGTNMCHRSARSYPYTVVRGRALALTHKACSGAIIPDFYQPNTNGNQGEQPQLDHLDANTRLVTLSIGGNDVGFSYVLKECMNPFQLAQCFNIPEVVERINLSLDDLRNGHPERCITLEGYPPICNPAAPSLQGLYRDIAERAPNAQIVVANYPSLFIRHPKKDCGLLTKDEVLWLNDQGLRLDKVITQQVSAAAKAGVKVRLANAYSTFGDHGRCTKDPWILGIEVEWFGIKQTSFHPTEKGQDAYARAIQKALPA
jgi:lysophospholipase L1-like esterase